MKHQGWGAVVIDMICRRVCGLVPDDEGIRLDPLDIGLRWFRLENVAYHGHRLDIVWSQTEGYCLNVDGKPAARKKTLKPMQATTRKKTR